MPSSFGACESQKELWIHWDNRCKNIGETSEFCANNLGPFGVVGVVFAPFAKDACDTAESLKEDYDRCVEYFSLIQEYHQKELERSKNKKIIQDKIESVTSVYFNEISDIHAEYEEARKMLIDRYLFLELDMDDPEISSHFSKQLQEIERQLVIHLLSRMKVQ